MKFDGILICTDLDGTLYRGDKTISKENRDAIEYFKQNGGLFTFMTGRMASYSRDAYQAIEPNVPFGCINGGGLFDHKAGRYVWAETIDRSVLRLVERVERLAPEIGIIIETLGNVYFSRVSGGVERFIRVTGLPRIEAHFSTITEPIGKILFSFQSEEEFEHLKQVLFSDERVNDFGFIRSARSLCELLPKGIHKGTAIKKLTEILNLDPNKTVAIGDFNNDIGMFQTAKIGVAVANACDEAKAAADYITVSNEEHAIARVILDIKNGKLKI